MEAAVIKKFQASINKMREKVIKANGGEGFKGLTPLPLNKEQKTVKTSKEREATA